MGSEGNRGGLKGFKPPQKTWGRVVSSLLLLMVLAYAIQAVPMLAPYSSTYQAEAHKPNVTPQAQPQLLEIAARNPGAMVSVIVQKAKTDAGQASAEALVERAGGKVTMDLHIIHAFAATM